MKKQFVLAVLVVLIICGQIWAQAPDTVWVRSYNGPANGDDRGIGCAADSFGNLYVTGISSNGSNYDYLTVKYNTATGETLWTRRYNGPADGNDGGTSCAVDNSGNLYVFGTSFNNVSHDDFLLIKYDAATGDTIWTRRHEEPDSASNKGWGCAVGTAGSLYVTGMSHGGGPETDYLTVKYDAATGDTLWTRKYNGPAGGDDEAFDCATDPSGNLFVAGYSFNGADWNLLMVKYNPDGDTLWTRRSAATLDSLWHEMAGCATDNSGNAYITGMCGLNAGYQNRYCVTIKYDPSGTPLWTSIYDSPTVYDASSGCAATPSGDKLYITGTSYRGPHDHYLTVCCDAATGDTVWSRTYLSSNGRTEYSIGCAVDGSGNLYISGMSMDSMTWIGNYQTIKYATATGVAGEPAEMAEGRAVKLLPSQPNPFSQRTNISYQLDRAGRVSLTIYNIAGQKIKNLADASQNAGTHSISWDGRDEKGIKVCAGVYFSCLQAGDHQATGKITLVR